MKNYDLHPLCTLFPRMDGEAFKTLVADIKANGQREPITLHDGMILDGGNRYRACLAADRVPQFEPFRGDNIVAFVLSKNLHRRHLTAGQNAAIVASAQDWAKAHLPHREKGGSVHPSDTVESRAKTSGASRATQQRADKVAKADPKLAKQVARGETTLPAAVEKITGKRPGAKKPQPAAPAISDDDHADLVRMCEEQQRELDALNEQLAAAQADDLKAEAIKWRKACQHAEAAQGEAMDAAAACQKREKWSINQLRRCMKALGETDIRNVASSVEALARDGKPAARMAEPKGKIVKEFPAWI